MNAKTLGWLLGVIRVQQYVGKLEKMEQEKEEKKIVAEEKKHARPFFGNLPGRTSFVENLYDYISASNLA